MKKKFNLSKKIHVFIECFFISFFEPFYLIFIWGFVDRRKEDIEYLPFWIFIGLFHLSKTFIIFMIKQERDNG